MEPTNIRHPDHPKWNDAKFDTLDASAMMLMAKDGSVLIYWHGDDTSHNIIIPYYMVDKIVHHYFQR